MKIIDCIQGSPEWHAAKLGVASASNFSKILAKGQGKTRKAYMLRLAAEILSSEPQETYSNAAMERGIEIEPQAREYYEGLNGVKVEQVGFCKLDDNIGCSPDGLVGTDGGIEIKCPNTTTHITYILADKLPSEYVAQVQGSLWVTDRKWWEFQSFDPRLKGRPFWSIRVERDEAYINKLAIEVNQFIIELEELIAGISSNPF